MPGASDRRTALRRRAALPVEANDAHPLRVAQVMQQIHVVIDAQDRAPLTPQLAEQAIHVELLGGIEVVRGFVEKQYLGLLRDQAGDRDALPLAAGQLSDAVAIRVLARADSR